MVLFFSSLSYSQLVITELADPNDNTGARYVEIYNVSANDVDLTDWELRRWTNAGTNPQGSGIDLSSIGLLPAGSFVLVAANGAEFTSAYGFAPDIDAGTGGAADSNGDDQIAIFDAADNTIDIFGVPGEDGSGTCHEFEDGRAERIASVTASNPVWDESEWNVWADSQVSGCTSHTQQPVNEGDGIYDPGVWIGESSDEPTLTSSENELTEFIQFVGAPSAEQMIDISGSNLSADVSITDSGDYEISLTSSTGFSTNLLLSPVSGELTSTTLYVRLNGLAMASPSNGNLTLTSTGANDLTVTLSGEILNPDPVLFSSEDTLNGFSHFVGTPSIEQSFEVSGNYLTEDVTIDVTGEFEISLTSNGTFSNSLLLTNTGGTVENTAVFVRLNGIADNDNQEGLVTVSSASTPGAFTVNAGNYYYSPMQITVHVGDTVYWVNDGGFHNVNFSTNTVTGDPYNNPESFVSSPTSDLELYSYVFNTAGTYQYDCSVGAHAANGMIGSIVVLENSDPEPGIVVLSGETLDYSSYSIGQVTTNDANGVADSLGLLVSLEGVVHCIDFDGNEGLSFTIIDIDNNGINVYNFNDVSSYVVSEGDLIKVWGVIDQYNGLTEVIPDSIEVLSTGNATVTPSLVTGLNEDTESQWITIQNVDFVTPIATFASGSSNIDVTDGTNVYTLRIDSDTDIPESSTPQGPFDVTGVGGQYDSSDPYDSGYQLFPCGLGSFVPSSTTQLDETMMLNVFRAYPNPFNNMIQVSLTQQGAFEIVVMDVQGRILLHESINQSMNIDTKDWNSGIYMISVQDSKGLVQIQKVIK
jgi:plastocyanin